MPELARSTRRWLLTFDADFGELVFHQGELPPQALLYFRLHPIVLAEVLKRTLQLSANVRDRCIAVVARDGVRMPPFASSTPIARWMKSIRYQLPPCSTGPTALANAA